MREAIGNLQKNVSEDPPHPRSASDGDPRSPAKPFCRGWVGFRSALHWANVYSLTLFTLILSYQVIVLFGLIELLRLAIHLLARILPPSQFDLLTCTCLVLVLLLSIRFGVHLFRALRAVVSERHDTGREEIQGVPLQREQCEELYGLLAEVSQIVGAPIPDQVRVTHRTECYVTELRTFYVTVDRRFVLVLGLPNLAVLSCQELKVVLAHEFGHIVYGDTRLDVFVFRFLAFLRSVVSGSNKRWQRVDPLLWLAWLSFGVLRRLSAPIRHYQELRADALSARAYGGEMAVQTLLKDWILGQKFAATVASFVSENGARPGHPADNVYCRFTDEWRELSGPGQAYLERRLAEEEQSSFWDTHPTAEERIRVMRRFPAPRAEDRRPARELLGVFDQLAAQLHEVIFREGAERQGLGPDGRPEVDRNGA